MKRIIVATLPLMAFALACSSVEDQTIAETSEDELREVCEDNKDIFLTTDNEGLIRGSCIAGLAAQEQCNEESLPACIEGVKQQLQGQQDLNIDCSEVQKGDVSNCDITVGEWLDCMEAITDQYDSYASLTCADADKVTTAPPAVCAALAERCPQMLGDSESG